MISNEYWQRWMYHWKVVIILAYSFRIKKTQASFGLRKRLPEFFLFVAYVKFMVIPHLGWSKTWAISKYVFNITFVWNILEKTLLFQLKLDLKKQELVEYKNDIHMGIIFILVGEKWKGGSPLKYWGNYNLMHFYEFATNRNSIGQNRCASAPARASAHPNLEMQNMLSAMHKMQIW